MARSSPPKPTSQLPPLLAHLIRAAARDSRDRASALNDLAQLFLLIVPMHGVEPAEHVREAIEKIAARHLKRRDAESELKRAVARVPGIKERDAIESACVQLLESGELAHYYAGLAAGITLAQMNRTPAQR
jgi:hypothetical protein